MVETIHFDTEEERLIWICRNIAKQQKFNHIKPNCTFKLCDALEKVLKENAELKKQIESYKDWVNDEEAQVIMADYHDKNERLEEQIEAVRVWRNTMPCIHSTNKLMRCYPCELDEILKGKNNGKQKE